MTINFGDSGTMYLHTCAGILVRNTSWQLNSFFFKFLYIGRVCSRVPPSHFCTSHKQRQGQPRLDCLFKGICRASPWRIETVSLKESKSVYCPVWERWCPPQSKRQRGLLEPIINNVFPKLGISRLWHEPTLKAASTRVGVPLQLTGAGNLCTFPALSNEAICLWPKSLTSVTSTHKPGRLTCQPLTELDNSGGKLKGGKLTQLSGGG